MSSEIPHPFINISSAVVLDKFCYWLLRSIMLSVRFRVSRCRRDPRLISRTRHGTLRTTPRQQPCPLLYVVSLCMPCLFLRSFYVIWTGNGWKNSLKMGSYHCVVAIVCVPRAVFTTDKGLGVPAAFGSLLLVVLLCDPSISSNRFGGATGAGGEGFEGVYFAKMAFRSPYSCTLG